MAHRRVACCDAGRQPDFDRDCRGYDQEDIDAHAVGDRHDVPGLCFDRCIREDRELHIADRVDRSRQLRISSGMSIADELESEERAGQEGERDGPPSQFQSPHDGLPVTALPQD